MFNELPEGQTHCYQDPEICICAAVRAKDGSIVRGHRHAHALWTMRTIPRYKDERPYGDDQGFITSRNRYVTRREGYQLQNAAGIKSVLEGTEHEDAAYAGGELFSEDLY